MSQLEYKFFYQRHLPHYQPPGATLFVTFRLAGSIPQAMLYELMAESDRIEKILASIPDPVERARLADIEQRRQFSRWDRTLDTASSGPYWLSTPDVAQLVCDTLHFLNGKQYDLDAYCIMPNHGHVVFKPLLQQDGVYCPLAKTMHSFKTYTAKRANVLLGRTGQFWHHERYDHVVRDEAEWHRIVNYVLNNPVKAGLVADWHEWSWTFCQHL